MMEAVRTSETSVDNHSIRQYNPEDSSEHHTRRRENLKSHIVRISVLIPNDVCSVTACLRVGMQISSHAELEMSHRVFAVRTYSKSKSIV